MRGIGSFLLFSICAASCVQVTVSAERAGTLEDLYGDTGNTFQAAIGFVNFEGFVFPAEPSYGLGIDDMVVKWREFSLIEDASDCAVSGSCAAIELHLTNVFEGSTTIGVRLVEASPLPTNDCDLDGTDDGTDDCDLDGVRDLVALATSEGEADGELVVLNQRSPGEHVYMGTLAISALGDSDPGVLFVNQQGTELPTVTVTYEDLDDGTGTICKNDVDPARWGKVQAATTVFLGPTCEIAVLGAEITDNGDRDFYADTEETVEMVIEYVNNCGFDLHGCVARLWTNSPEVDCVIDAIVDLGDIADDGEPVLAPEAFLWKVADVERRSPDLPFDASFDVTISCDEIDGLSVPQTVEIPLDLDYEDFGQTATAWVEDFESATLGKFAAENLDSGLPGNSDAEGLINADGWRCQYSDPDWPNSSTYGNDSVETCFPGLNLAHADRTFWQVDGQTILTSPDGGRGFSGSHSMYYGIFLTSPAGQFTTPMAVVESVATTDPINLASDEFASLSFWHQVSLADSRTMTAFPPLRSADRGVVQIQRADGDGAGTPIGPWTSLIPYQNSYDERAIDHTPGACMFDPVDDGSTEDDFFDPADPNRRTGPSSTCFPEPTFGFLGDTEDFGLVYCTQSNATWCPTPVEPDFGRGTWVESRVDLSEYRGQRIRLRFLVASLKTSYADWEELFAFNPSPNDDGWWIDLVQVDKTFEQPAQLLVDTDQLRSCAGDPDVGCLDVQDCADAGVAGPCDGQAPQCGATCNVVTVGVETDPDADASPLTEELPAPGQALQLNAVSSFADRCLDGTLQYRFVSNGVELRGWSENPIFVIAPQESLDVDVEVRCSSEVSCRSSAVVDVDVHCPKASPGPLFPSIRAATGTTWTWSGSTSYDVFRGDSISGFYPGTILASDTGTSFTDVETPAEGGFFWYVARIGAEFCNETGAWSSGGPFEVPTRESALP